MRLLDERDAASSLSRGVGRRSSGRATRRVPGFGWSLAPLSALWAVSLTACGLGAGRRAADGHARLRRAPAARLERPAGAWHGDGHEPADAKRQDHDALWRRL